MCLDKFNCCKAKDKIRQRVRDKSREWNKLELVAILCTVQDSFSSNENVRENVLPSNKLLFFFEQYIRVQSLLTDVRIKKRLAFISAMISWEVLEKGHRKKLAMKNYPNVVFPN